MHHEIESTSSLAEEQRTVPAGSVSSDREPTPQALVVRGGNENSNQLAFFVHGTPGTASDWDLVFEELSGRGSDCEVVALDRPGFGENVNWSRAEEWKIQLDCFRSILLDRAKGEGRLVIVGHSYGAALALGLAERLDADDCVSGLILVSGVLSPKEQQCRWYHRVVLNPIVGSVLPRRYVQSAKEMSAVESHIEALDSTWSRLAFPVTLIHGDEDSLIPIENSRYALDKSNSNTVRLVEVPGGGHALTKTHASLIADEVVRIFGKIQGEEATRG